jgi:hypothetical protein
MFTASYKTLKGREVSRTAKEALGFSKIGGGARRGGMGGRERERERVRERERESNRDGHLNNRTDICLRSVDQL